MDSKRQTQVAGLVQKELANILQFKFNGLVLGRLLTITGVRMSPDLGLAKIYLSIFPSTDGQSIIKEINTNVSRIRYELGNAIRNDVRRVPELIFYLDDSFDEVERIEKALKS
ncbi:MAG: 30S ribosome-binding factor RbfA [Bacteroidales bacterium]|nr:30S ribosome-binding factor RbfA [Bacteroidales bacterium]MBQ4475567.1 30S ribosome-binding factor RbfA [Bacteroidales bacterium]